MSGSPPPSKIMIIRHAEKPPHPNTTGPWDVQLDGTPGGGRSLVVKGWHRAGALVQFFAQLRPALAIETPQYIYAASPLGIWSRRSWETVSPLAAWLGYGEGSSSFNTAFEVGCEEDLVTSLLGHSGAVLICWEHHHIKPDIIGNINSAYPIANYDEIPSEFPGVFNLVWVLDLNGGSYIWSSIPQNLIAGDVSWNRTENEPRY